MSQTMINAGLEELYKKSPDMQKMFDLNNLYGKIEAEFLAPRVIVPGADQLGLRNNIIVQTRFKSGKLTDPDAELADVSEQIKTETAKQPQDAKKLKNLNIRLAKARRNYENVTNFYEIPRDYLIHRLFLKLTAANWGNFDRFSEYSQAGYNKSGKKISIQDWLTDNPTEGQHSPETLLPVWMQTWSKKVSDNGTSILGTTFKMPKSPNYVLPPTFIPTYLSHQAYGYKSKEYNCADGMTGLVGSGSRNALLYCEMVENHEPPRDPLVTWAGNFITHPSTSQAKDQIDGAFLMSRNVFMEEFVLKNLQQMNRSNEFIWETPYAQKNPDNGNEYSSYMGYGIGYDSGHPDPKDSFYSFIPSDRDAMSNAPVKYTWERWLGQPGVKDSDAKITMHEVNGTSNLKQHGTSHMSSEVVWTPGTTKIVASGKIEIAEIALWDQGLSEPNFSPDHLTGWVDDRYLISWKIGIEIVPNTDKYGNGFLDVKIDTGDKKDGNLKVVQTQVKRNVKPGSRCEKMEEYVTGSCAKVVPPIVGNIEEAFRKAGRFVYPGNGTLQFSDPVFNKYGDLIATITHKPIAEGVKIVVPTPPEFKDIPQGEMKLYVPEPLLAPSITFRLTWEVKTETLVTGKKGKITLISTNKSLQPRYFQEITVLFKSASIGKYVFANDRFMTAEDYVKELAKPAEESVPTVRKGDVAQKDASRGKDETSKSTTGKVEDANAITGWVNVDQEGADGSTQAKAAEGAADSLASSEGITGHQQDQQNQQVKTDEAKGNVTKDENPEAGSGIASGVANKGPASGNADTTSKVKSFIDNLTSGFHGKPKTPKGNTPKEDLTKKEVPKGESATETNKTGSTAPLQTVPVVTGSSPSASLPPPGIISVTHASKVATSQVVVRSPKQAAAQDQSGKDIGSCEWQAVVRSAAWNKKNVTALLKIDQGESVSITLDGKIGLPGSYDLFIDEIWTSADGQIEGHRIEPRLVAIV